MQDTFGELFLSSDVVLTGRKHKGPLAHAFITTNPLLPADYYAPKGGVDEFVRRLNKDCVTACWTARANTRSRWRRSPAPWCWINWRSRRSSKARSP